MEKKIKIVKDGPYIVQGDIPIFEKIIAVKDGNCYWKDGRELPQAETYSLCRCGKSNNAPFCDGSHKRFDGMELADTDPYDKRAKLIEGPTIDLKDDRRCAKAGFCHSRDGSTWELLEKSDDPEMRNEFIRAACECPTGRTVAIDKDGTIHEDKLDPSIYIVQDPSNNVSGGIYVMGGIPLQSADGEMYETRNRYVLCRCGASKDRPFCDARHISFMYKDSRGSFKLFGKKKKE